MGKDDIELSLADVGIVDSVFEAPEDAEGIVEELNLY